MTVVNQHEIPADLAPGSYCCRLDESSTLAAFRVRFVVPPRSHEPGDCLVQITKAADVARSFTDTTGTEA